MAATRHQLARCSPCALLSPVQLFIRSLCAWVNQLPHSESGFPLYTAWATLDAPTALDLAFWQRRLADWNCAFVHWLSGSGCVPGRRSVRRLFGSWAVSSRLHRRCAGGVPARRAGRFVCADTCIPGGAVPSFLRLLGPARGQPFPAAPCGAVGLGTGCAWLQVVHG